MSERNIIVGTAAGQGLGVPGVGGLYGVIGKITATSGQRGALTEILLEATADMPGCLSYVIAEDSIEPDLLWITEVWDSQASHAASISLPSVRAAIAQAKPLIAGLERVTETRPLGGQGL